MNVPAQDQPTPAQARHFWWTLFECEPTRALVEHARARVTESLATLQRTRHRPTRADARLFMQQVEAEAGPDPTEEAALAVADRRGLFPDRFEEEARTRHRLLYMVAVADRLLEDL